MNIDIKEHIPAGFDVNSKVWIYQSNRQFLMSEAVEIEAMLHNFVANWKSHADTVKGFAHLFWGQFIILMADETQSGVSGCSTDSSVHLIKAIEQKFNADLFNRQNLAFIIQDKVQLIPLPQLNDAAENNFINADTLYFNNTVLTKKELLEKWIVPVKESWLAKRLPAKV
jgi:hypothetical protein